MARALMEGTRDHDAIGLRRGDRAARRLASTPRPAGTPPRSRSTSRPSASRPALELVVEVAARPTFPEGEVERLRDERLNDILQARADPRRRAEEAFVGAIYAPSSPYRRLVGRDDGDGRAPRCGDLAGRARPALRSGPDDPHRRRRPDRPRRRAARRGAVRRLGRRSGGDALPVPSTPRRPPRTAGSSSSTGRARSRPRSGSATRAPRAGSPTSTPSR